MRPSFAVRLANTDPVAMMLMVGDQIYADATAGIGDGMSAVEKIKYRYECAFNAPGFAQMAQWTPLVMAIDDHEIGDGWSADRLAILPGGAELLRAGLAGYCAFEHAHAPRSKNFAAADGFNSTFEVGGVAFAIVDTRSQRTLLGSVPSVLSVAQMDALKTWLTSAPQDSPKVIISGAVFAPLLEEDAFGGITADSWALAQDQRKDLLDFIDEEEIQRVLFISGDYHLDAFAEIAFRNGHKAHALVTPPLYAPLPFINAVTRNVVREEKIGNARIRSLGAGDGNGLLDVRLARGEKGQWVMTLITHWLRAEDAEPQFKSRTRTVVL
jgi:cholesterol oxidase